MVLLNGAKEKHLVKPFYRKSRGLIVLEIASENDSLECWKKIDLTEIEPFTMVLLRTTNSFNSNGMKSKKV